MTLQHLQQKRPENRPFEPPLPIVHASNMIPHEQRAWTCAFCDHGLPYLTSKSQRQKSVRFHYQTKHKHRVVNHKTKQAAFAKRKKANNAPPRVLKRWSNNTEKDVNINGHDLVKWEPIDSSIIGTWRPHLHRYTCRLCRKINVYSRVSKNVCAKAGGDCYWHRLPDNEKHKLLSIWKLTLQEAENIIPKPPDKKAKFEITKELATFDKNRLVQQGIEPNPGPHHTRRKSVPKPILIKTINVQGIPGAWRALEAWSNTVLLAQDTPFSSEELKSFSRAARPITWLLAKPQEDLTEVSLRWYQPTMRQQPLYTTDGNIQICVIE